MPVKIIDAKTLKHWLDNGEAIIVDVREPAEYAAKNIKGAKLLPIGKICKNDLPVTQGKKIVLHCQLGKRGAMACEKLLMEDASLEVYNLEGGLSKWVEEGLPVESSGKFFLPIDRQVQISIGMFVFIGSILIYYISPLFVLLTGFFGAGLIFAGISGTCGFAKLLAKMPWNQKADH